MKFALAIFVRLNIFAFCVFLNLHEADGLPPMMSRFLNRFVYRRGKGKRHTGPHRHRPVVFDDTYPADTEIVFRLADNYNVPSVDYSQIDFGTTYNHPPVENTYMRPPPAPISLHHYNSAPAPATHYSKPSFTSSSSFLNPGVTLRVPSPGVAKPETPSQIISSLKLSTNLQPPSSINSILDFNAFSPFSTKNREVSSSSSFLNTGMTPRVPTPGVAEPETPSQSTSSLNLPTNLQPPSSINSILDINAFSPFLTKNREVLPVIEIGKAPPPKYKAVDNFQQSFQVTLTSPSKNKKKRSFEQSSAYTAPSSNSGYSDLSTSGYSTPVTGYLSQSTNGVPTISLDANANNNNKGPVNAVVRSKQGSIVTRNKIYFSPPLLAHRSQPFRIGRRIPPEKPSVNIFTGSNKTISVINNASLIVDASIDKPDKTEDDKTYVAVRLQSYSTLRPPTNDSDLIEAQKDYGFGAHTFLFGDSDNLLSVFEMLLRTDFENKGGQNQFANNFGGPSLSSGNSLEDTIDCIRNFVNATERIHFWSHSRGESDAGSLFQLSPRDPVSDAIPFIDTAAVTETLSATVF